jgi:predicted Zn-dependent protease
MPDFMSLTDNPLIAEYQGFKMQGISKVDEDGVPSREVKLVENGYLKSLLTSRDPVRGFEQSTGSRHVGQATPTNLIVTSTNALSNEDLRAKFIALINQRHLPFGMIVRRLRNANTPVLAYKVFPDGREELVRNMQFTGMNAAAFKDIVATSKDLNVLTVQYRPQNNQFAFLSLPEENYRPVTVVAPSLLFEDATLRRIRTAAPNPPVATHPFFDK